MSLKKYLFIFFFLCSFLAIAQDCPNDAFDTTIPIHTNDFTTTMSTDGSIFLDGLKILNDSNQMTYLAFEGGLWVGGLFPNGDLVMAAQMYGAHREERDFYPGPIDASTYMTSEENCVLFDTTWHVTKNEIETHLLDFHDNGNIDNPIGNIFGWPAHQNQNSYFYEYNGFNLPAANTDWAAFYDKNQNNLYEPNLGEYPIPPTNNPTLIPEILAWNVMNDLAGPHQVTNGDPLSIEVQQTLWSYKCADFSVLENTIFQEYKIINRGLARIDSMSAGIWMDYDVGCYTDDYLGSIPNQNALFAYNTDPIDGSWQCTSFTDYPNFNVHPPMQSLTFLNRKMDKVIMFGTGGTFDPSPAQLSPSGSNKGIEFYNFLNGHWRDSSPLYYGGLGLEYMPDSNAVKTSHVFPSDPRDENGWSMHALELSSAPWTPIGSTYQDVLLPNEVLVLQTAHTFNQDTTLYHLEKYDLMTSNIATLQNLHDSNFETVSCVNTTTTMGLENENEILIYPNPTNNEIHFSIPNSMQINSIYLYNTNGQLMQNWDAVNLSSSLNLSNLNAGIYIMTIQTNKGLVNKKVMISFEK